MGDGGVKVIVQTGGAKLVVERDGRGMVRELKLESVADVPRKVLRRLEKHSNVRGFAAMARRALRG